LGDILDTWCCERHGISDFAAPPYLRVLAFPGFYCRYAQQYTVVNLSSLSNIYAIKCFTAKFYKNKTSSSRMFKYRGDIDPGIRNFNSDENPYYLKTPLELQLQVYRIPLPTNRFTLSSKCILILLYLLNKYSNMMTTDS